VLYLFLRRKSAEVSAVAYLPPFPFRPPFFLYLMATWRQVPKSSSFQPVLARRHLALLSSVLQLLLVTLRICSFFFFFPLTLVDFLPIPFPPPSEILARHPQDVNRRLFLRPLIRLFVLLFTATVMKLTLPSAGPSRSLSFFSPPSARDALVARVIALSTACSFLRLHPLRLLQLTAPFPLLGSVHPALFIEKPIVELVLVGCTFWSMLLAAIYQVRPLSQCVAAALFDELRFSPLSFFPC